MCYTMSDFKNTDLKTVTHFKLVWECECKNRTDVDKLTAFQQCPHEPIKTLDYIELVKKNDEIKSGLSALFGD